MRRGFTLIELAFVVAVIAILTAVTVPIAFTVVQRARVEEARATLHLIAHAQLQHRRDQGAYLPCAAVGEVPKTPVPFATAECWEKLGVVPEGRVRYRYSVDVEGDAFTVVAEGDLDADGTASRLTLDGRTLDVAVQQEFE